MNYNTFDYIVVGCGFYGATVAERLASAGYKVCIIDKRDHVGGNCYDKYDDETGILYHVYGPHIFHANDDQVICYLKQFTEFTQYYHQVLSYYDGKIYQMPINLETINTFYGLDLKPYEVKSFMERETAKYYKPQPANMEEKGINLIGKPLFDAFFREYTIKQWGMDPRDLSEKIINRIPVRNNYHESYYEKKFQGIPAGGYTQVFEKMLDNDNIVVQLGTDYFEVSLALPETAHIVFSGAIDAYFNYEFGKLEYRTIVFEREVMGYQDWQGTSVVNYPETKYPFTRICEPRHFHRELWDKYPEDKTLVFREFSKLDDGSAPFYPIKNVHNDELARKYRDKAATVPNVTFGGRLGEYQYYDMDTVIARALADAVKLGASSV